ncbi:MAG: hypothetical protein KKD38_05295, partial [Candidatus Delongbacteria bacterium]|nr:hypothetical protein [Candidatus Delongbacteria bacterium]
GLYNLDIEGLFGAGNAIGVELVTTEVVPGSPVTTCKLSKNGSFVKDLPIGNFAGGYSGVAVPEKYGTVSIKGVSAKDFSLITEKDQVLVTDDFYLWEMRDVKAELEAGYSDVIDPDEATLEWLWDEMLAKNPEGHLAVIAGLGVTVYDKDWPPIYLPNETLIFSNASYLTQMGELGAKGTGQTDLRMWNIGSVMVLNQQEIMSGPSDTAQKWPKIFIQDQRYLNPTENLPPFCGEGPSDHPSESLKSLNPNHTWSRGMKSGKTDDWRTVVWRNGSP